MITSQIHNYRSKTYYPLNLFFFISICIFLFLGLYQVITFTSDRFQIQKFVQSQQALRAENDDLMKKITAKNSLAELYQISTNNGFVKSAQPEYIHTIQDIFVSK